MTFFIDGKPMGKERPRFCNGHTYTPSKTREYEEYVRLLYKANGGIHHGDKPIALSVVAWYGMPQSFNKKERLDAIEGKKLPTVKPDLDNIIKVICDALNGLAWNDDKQIVSIVSSKFYDPENKPCVAVTVREYEAE